MRIRILSVLGVIAAMLLPASANAGRTERTSSAEQNRDVKTAYIFSVSFSFADSTVYMTEIQKMDSVEIYSGHFMVGRDAYSSQFKTWLENGGAPTQISSLYFFTKKSKAVKKQERVRKRVLLKRGRTIVLIPEFKFSPIS